MREATWKNAVSADGQALAEYIAARIDYPSASDQVKRYLRMWRAGAQPSFLDADDALCRVGLHVSQVPASLWSFNAPVELTVCVGCGEPLSGKDWQQQVFCSPSCARLYGRGREGVAA